MVNGGSLAETTIDIISISIFFYLPDKRGARISIHFKLCKLN